MASNRPHDPSRRYHDRVARQYDAIYDDPYWAFHDELTWRTVKRFIPKQLSACCADLGCGTGKWGLKLLKSGLATTFVDHSAAMIGQVQSKLNALGPKARHATLVVADIAQMDAVPSERFRLSLAMGDPLSICSEPDRAVLEMRRITQPGGIVIATADSKLAALDYFVERGNLDALEEFVRTGRTHWLTADRREQFELTMFTPDSLRKLFEKRGFEVVSLHGKPVIPIRQNKHLLTHRQAIPRLLKLEQELARDSASVGRAGHLQIVARRP